MPGVAEAQPPQPQPAEELSVLREPSLLTEVLDALPEACAIVHGTRILHINLEFTRLFGFSPLECAGQDLVELVVPDGRRHEHEMILHALRQSGRMALDTRRRTRWGEEVDVWLLVTPLDLGGDAAGRLVTYRDIRRQKEQQAMLLHRSRHDALTGLPNRSLFLEQVGLTLARLRRRPDRSFAVVFLDLDGFKQVNDSRGHAAGDALLLVVAERLRHCLRPQDTVARFGGDEFALLLDECGNEQEARHVASRLQTALRQRILIDHGEVQVSASMGIVLARPDHEAADVLVGFADAAMYRAKASGGGCEHLHL